MNKQIKLAKRIPNKQGGVFIAPSNCDSTIMWNIGAGDLIEPEEGEKYYLFEGTINLTDCNRIISWSIGPWDNPLTKVRNAIKELQKVEKYLEKYVEGNKI